MPSDAATQIVDAVVSPRTSSPWRRMLPAPRKPTPVTICAAIRVGSTDLGKSGINPSPVNMHEPALISANVRSPAGCPRNSRSAPMQRPSNSATETRRARSSSPVSCVLSASAGTSSGRRAAGFVLGTRLVGKLREVQAVDEVAEDREPLFVDDGAFRLVLVAVELVCLGDDARGLHHLRGDEDRTLDTDRERNCVGRAGVEVEVPT